MGKRVALSTNHLSSKKDIEHSSAAANHRDPKSQAHEILSSFSAQLHTFLIRSISGIDMRMLENSAYRPMTTDA